MLPSWFCSSICLGWLCLVSLPVARTTAAERRPTGAIRQLSSTRFWSAEGISELALTIHFGGADDPKPGPDNREKSTVTLKVGDRAPSLKADKWLQGKEVPRFQPGKVYVIDFWATWCGPCLMIMPHLADLQTQYRDKGVITIAYSVRDKNNTEQAVTTFLKKRGPWLPCTFAFADDRATYDKWMTAAGEHAIPCAFVVDKTGRIVFIGHPLYLGIVLPRILTGTSAQAIKDEVNKIDGELHTIARALNGADAKAGLKALKDFERKYPPLADNPYWLRERFHALVKAGQVDQAVHLAQRMITRANRVRDGDTLWLLSVYLRGESEPNHKLVAAAVQAAEGMVQAAGDTDAKALINLATCYAAAGDELKAKQFARNALQHLAGAAPALRPYIEREARGLLIDKARGEK